MKSKDTTHSNVGSTANTNLENIGQTRTRCCRFCGQELSNDNWYKANQRKKDYKCNTCETKTRRAYHLKQKAREVKVNTLKAYNKIKEGYVYVISNPAWQEWVKIGMAVDADDRCSGYQTSSPFRDYQVEARVYYDDRREAEHKAHQLAEQVGERRGEWFKLEKHVAVTLIQSLH